KLVRFFSRSCASRIAHTSGASLRYPRRNTALRAVFQTGVRARSDSLPVLVAFVFRFSLNVAKAKAANRAARGFLKVIVSEFAIARSGDILNRFDWFLFAHEVSLGCHGLFSFLFLPVIP